MTQDQLSRANELHEKIVNTQKMIASLQNSYGNTIMSYTSTGNMHDKVYESFSPGEALHIIILDYFKARLEVLQREFNNL